MIYFAQPVGGGPIKIGHSNNVARRVARLSANYGTRLVVLATIEGDREREKVVHERFAHLRIHPTEQFRPGLDLLEFIGCPSAAHPDPDTVKELPVRSRVGIKSIWIHLSPEAHRNLRVAAAAADMSVPAYAREAIRYVLNNHPEFKQENPARS